MADKATEVVVSVPPAPLVPVEKSAELETDGQGDSVILPDCGRQMFEQFYIVKADGVHAAEL